MENNYGSSRRSSRGHLVKLWPNFVRQHRVDSRSPQNGFVCQTRSCDKVRRVSSVQEIQAAIPKLSRAEIEQIREWIEDYLEDRLELSDEVKTKLDQSRADVSAGNYTERRAK
jgi:hypothetical protein